MKQLRLKKGVQMSDTSMVMIFLTLSGGLQDAYSYFVRDKVFANAQTGNFVLMAMDFFTGKFYEGEKYLLPIFAFGMGILVAEQMQGRVPNIWRLHWRQFVLLVEIIILAIVGLIPVGPILNPIANALTSFACAMQIQAFKKVNGYPYASTMCIGNTRNGMEALSAYLRTKDKALLRRAGQYFMVIFIFFIGAGMGSLLSLIAGENNQYVILGTCVLLSISFFLMLFHEES